MKLTSVLTILSLAAVVAAAPVEPRSCSLSHRPTGGNHGGHQGGLSDKPKGHDGNKGKPKNGKPKSNKPKNDKPKNDKPKGGDKGKPKGHGGSKGKPKSHDGDKGKPKGDGGHKGKPKNDKPQGHGNDKPKDHGNDKPKDQGNDKPKGNGGDAPKDHGKGDAHECNVCNNNSGDKIINQNAGGAGNTASNKGGALIEGGIVSSRKA